MDSIIGSVVPINETLPAFLKEDRRKAVAKFGNGKRKFEYLIKWQGWDIYDATWYVSATFMQKGNKVG